LFNDKIKLTFFKGKYEFTWLQYEMRTEHMIVNLCDITFKNECYKNWLSNEPINISEIYDTLNKKNIMIVRDNNDFLFGLKLVENNFVEIFFSTNSKKAEQEGILEFMCYQATYLNNLFETLEF
jgi:hypothetical protein